MASPEEQFETWSRRQMYRAERKRLVRQLDRMEWGEIAAYLLIFVWIVGLFAAFHLGWLDADVAALVTFWILGAGAALVWMIRRHQASLSERIKALDASHEDVT